MSKLIKSEPYLNMEVNRPIPWVGMPICFYDSWFFVIDKMYNNYVFINNKTNYLCSYCSKTRNHFILPGEPNAPKMNKEFIETLQKSYLWGKSIKYNNGKWFEVDPHIYEFNETLRIPYGLILEDLFLNNMKNNFLDLKVLNSDGRENCASYGTKLKEPYPRIRYCEHCED